MIINKTGAEVDYKKEAVFALAYFVAYLGYLFYHPENEFMHWLTLVVLPFLFSIFTKEENFLPSWPRLV